MSEISASICHRPPDRGSVGRIILVMPDGEARVVAEMDGECLAEYDIEATAA